MEVLGIDAGNDNVKVASASGCNRFCSWIGEYRERKLKQTFGDDDMVFEYNGKMGFAGTLAKFESELGGSRKGESKAHEDAKLRTLLALHRYARDSHVKIVVGQPIGAHTDEEKAKIKQMLVGEHVLTVNGVTRALRIERCEVANEGGSAAFSDQRLGLQRYIDIGSGTINYATTYDMKWVDRDSFTEPFGLGTLNNRNVATITRKIVIRALDKWTENDKIRILGGGALNSELIKELSGYFPQSEVIKPKLRVLNGIQIVSPIYANAVGFYEIASKLYG